MSATDIDWDRPTWERRGTLLMEQAAQIGTPHERTEPNRWTSAAPTVPGWYFNRPRSTPGAVTVLLVYQGEFGRLFVLDPGGRTRPDRPAAP